MFHDPRKLDIDRRGDIDDITQKLIPVGVIARVVHTAISPAVYLFMGSVHPSVVNPYSVLAAAYVAARCAQKAEEFLTEDQTERLK